MAFEAQSKWEMTTQEGWKDGLQKQQGKVMKNDCVCSTAADHPCVTHPQHDSKGSSGPFARQLRALSGAAEGFGHLHPWQHTSTAA